MRQHLQGIDHVVIAVEDIDGSQSAYERLGFTVTPRGYHTMGSVNNCVMFEHDYFELLGIPTTHPALTYYRDFLKQGDGLAAIALMTDDAAGFHQELAQANVKSDAPLDFSRPVELSHGTFDAAFRITQIDTAETAAGRMFACQHFTRDVVWRPEYVTHANQVVGLSGVTVIADAPELAAIAASYGAIFDAAPKADNAFSVGFDVHTGNLPMQFTTGDSFDARYPGLRKNKRSGSYYAALGFRTANVAAVRETLTNNDVPFHEVGPDAIAVASQYCNGVVLVFSQ